MRRRPLLAVAIGLGIVAAAGSFAVADEPAPPPIAGSDDLAPQEPSAPAAGEAGSTGAAATPTAAPPSAGPPRLPPTAAQRATASDDLLARGLALEAVGLPVQAQAAFRKAERAGLGDKGVEAGRRADALGEAEEALQLAARRKSRPAKAALASALQTLSRQQQALGWPISPSLAGYLTQVASAVGDSGRARKLAALATAGDHDAVAFAGVATAAIRRRSPLRLYRCLGGPDRSDARALVALPDGYLVSGATGDGDGMQVWNWRVDVHGRVTRAGGFGADGLDRALAAVGTPEGIWIVGETSGRGGSDALALRIDAQLRPLAHADLDLGGAERATEVVVDGGGQVWMLVEGAVGDPAGPHRASWLVALGPDGKPRKQARLPIGRQAFVHTLLLDSPKGEAILYGGGRGVGESAGGLLRALSVGSATPDADEGPDFPGPLLAGAELGAGAMVLLGATGEGAGQRLFLAGRDKRRRWQKVRELPRGLHAASARLIAQRRGVLGLFAPADDAPAAETGGVYAIDARGRAKPLFEAPGFSPRAGVVQGREVVVVGGAQGCGRAGLDAAWVRLAL